MSSQRTILLGLFFLATLGVLGYYTLFLTEFTPFRDRPELRAYFSETNGLREGDPVLVAGMRWGRVKKMTFDPAAPEKKRIVLTASLNEPLALREGATIEIRDATLLGGKNVWIDPGPAGAKPIPKNQELFGIVSGGLLDRVTGLVSDSEAGISRILGNLEQVTIDLKEGKGVLGRLVSDQALADQVELAVRTATKTLEDVQSITADARAGKGTVGRLLSDDALFTDLSASARKLSTLLDEATQLAAEARAGDGALGRLVSDPALAADIAAAAGSLSSIARKIDEGRGLAGTLVNDEGLAQDLRDTMGTIARGEGTIGALIVRPEVYESLRAVTEDLSVVMSTVRSGQGSIGRLVMEDEIYQSVKTALQIVSRSLEEYREAAPITTFTSVFFSAF
ncbi:MAG: MlaD family protein [Planctomycetota bacterium]|nr:MlaD family protein [Planctomycetota bacterium]